LAFLNTHFGKSGQHFYNIVRGIQHSPVKPNRIRKSVGAERTYAQNLTSESEILDKLNAIGEELEKRLIKTYNKGKTVTIKIKFSDFTQLTRSKTIDDFIQKKEVFMPIVTELIQHEEFKKSVRLLGISITNLDNKGQEQEEKELDLQLKFDFYEQTAI